MKTCRSLSVQSDHSVRYNYNKYSTRLELYLSTKLRQQRECVKFSQRYLSEKAAFSFNIIIRWILASDTLYIITDFQVSERLHMG